MARRANMMPGRGLWQTLAMVVLVSIGGGSGVGAADVNPFSTLLGTWGGGGLASYSDGSKERLSCNAYYTGGGSQLRLAIYCKSPSHQIQMRGQVSNSGGRLSGSWEERTFNAAGSLSGKAAAGKLSMGIGGNVQGAMNVSYSKNQQSVSITATGVALRSVSMTLSRR